MGSLVLVGRARSKRKCRATHSSILKLGFQLAHPCSRIAFEEREISDRLLEGEQVRKELQRILPGLLREILPELLKQAQATSPDDAFSGPAR